MPNLLAFPLPISGQQNISLHWWIDLLYMCSCSTGCSWASQVIQLILYVNQLLIYFPAGKNVYSLFPVVSKARFLSQWTFKGFPYTGWLFLSLLLGAVRGKDNQWWKPSLHSNCRMNTWCLCPGTAFVSYHILARLLNTVKSLPSTDQAIMEVSTRFVTVILSLL